MGEKQRGGEQIQRCSDCRPHYKYVGTIKTGNPDIQSIAECSVCHKTVLVNNCDMVLGSAKTYLERLKGQKKHPRVLEINAFGKSIGFGEG